MCTCCIVDDGRGVGLINKTLPRHTCNTKEGKAQKHKKNLQHLGGKMSKKHKKKNKVPVSVPRMSVRLVHSKVTKASGEKGKICSITFFPEVFDLHTIV